MSPLPGHSDGYPAYGRRGFLLQLPPSSDWLDWFDVARALPAQLDRFKFQHPAGRALTTHHFPQQLTGIRDEGERNSSTINHDDKEGGT